MYAVYNSLSFVTDLDDFDLTTLPGYDEMAW